VLRVPPKVGPNERANRNKAEAACADVVEGGGHESAADPAPFDGRRDFGVHEHDHARPRAVPDLADDLAVEEGLVALLRRVVPDRDVGRVRRSPTVASQSRWRAFGFEAFVA
jgi:hypothetical protein